MRIVYLNPAAGLGGAERCLLDMMAAVRETEPSSELLLVTSAAGPLIERAKRLGVQVILLPMPKALMKTGDRMLGKDTSRGRAILELGRRGVKAAWPTWRYARSLTRTLTELGPDLVHSNGIKFHLLARLARLPRVPVVWHIHDFLGLRPLMARALLWASAHTRGGIAVSHAVQLDAQAVLRGLPVDVIYNGIDTDEFSPQQVPGAWLDHLAGFTEEGPETVRVGLVATFARWKGQEVFLQAAAQILRTQPLARARFFIIGGPIYETRGSQFSADELRSVAAALNIEPHVGFIPFQNDPANIYRALDIVVHASTQPEPFGRTIVEAMACAKPVIVSQAGGAAELFTHGHDALGVSPGDPAALASALSRLMTDPNHRRLLAANARRSAEGFSRRRLGPQLIAAYRRFLRASRAA